MAKLSNHDVEMIRELREVHQLSYRVIAEKFEASLSTIKNICWYRRR